MLRQLATPACDDFLRSRCGARSEQEVEHGIQRLTLGGAAAACVFNGLRGPWNFDRTLTQHADSASPALAYGTANFAPSASPHTWLYREDGYLMTEAGHFPITQEYRYTLDEAAGRLAVYFQRGENAGQHFHDVDFLAPEPAQTAPKKRTLRAQGYHPCAPDVYLVDYRFCFTGSLLAAFNITYVAKGPHKDYTSETHFSRPTGQE